MNNAFMYLTNWRSRLYRLLMYVDEDACVFSEPELSKPEDESDSWLYWWSRIEELIKQII